MQTVTVTTYVGQLIFQFYSLKSGLTLDLLAVSLACARSTVASLQDDIMATLRRYLVRAGYHPKRKYATTAAFHAD